MPMTKSRTVVQVPDRTNPSLLHDQVATNQSPVAPTEQCAPAPVKMNDPGAAFTGNKK